MKRIIICIFLLLCCPGFSLAQKNIDLSEIKPNQLKLMADNAIKAGDWYTAIEYYERYCSIDKANFESLYTLAELYRKDRDYKKAEATYELCYKKDQYQQPLVLFYLASMQKMNGKYVLAKENFLKFDKNYTSEKRYKILSKVEAEGCDLALQLMQNPLNVGIKHLDSTINKAHVEMSPFPLNDTLLLYASLPADTIKHYAADDTTQLPVRRFYMAWKKDGKWKGGKPFNIDVNQPESNNCNGAYSPSGKRFYFSRCTKNRKDKMICALYVCKKDRGIWQKPERLNREINRSGYSSSQPSVGLDSVSGKDVLYFVSDRPRGRGGADIWYTMYDDKNQSYKEPKNLGPGINTVGDEFTPYYDSEHNTLYFSSTGWPGLGGFDVFSSKGAYKIWTVPQNVGYPVNTSTDDIYYILSDTKEQGFLVSNREGGFALKNPTCCDDIYNFRLKEEIVPLQRDLLIETTVFESKDSSKTVYYNEEKPSDLISTMDKKPLNNIDVDLFDISDKNNPLLVKRETTSPDGKAFFKVNYGKDYLVDISQKGFFRKKVLFSTKNTTKTDTLKKNIIVKRVTDKPIILKNIYYDFDKAVLNQESKNILDTTLIKLMLDNPTLVIELSSHTDSKGDDNYNLNLSQQRAESVVQYIVSKGIAKERLVPKGYGESKPIEPNTKPDGSDNPEGRQVNRRTEFRVIGDTEIIYKR